MKRVPRCHAIGCNAVLVAPYPYGRGGWACSPECAESMETERERLRKVVDGMFESVVRGASRSKGKTKK